MLAFLVALAALAFFAFVGFAALSAFGSRRQPVRHFLLGPSVGLALTVLVLFLANRAGMSIRLAAWPVTGGLLALSGVTLWRRRPLYPVKSLAPFAIIPVVVMLLIGWPMFKFGYDWVSYANDDGSNYALWANNFLNHGWDDPVSPEEIAETRDGSRVAVFYYGSIMERPGAELLLAWLAALANKTTLAAMMPLLVGMHGALVLAAGGLVYRGQRRYLAALATCLLVGVSAPLSLGTLNQLMGQTGGLTLLCGSAAILFKPIRYHKWALLLRHGGLLGVLLCGVLIYYSELLPFLGLGFVIYAGIGLYRRRQPWRDAGITLGTAFALAAILLGGYFIGAIGFVLKQVQGGIGGSTVSLFPYYLHPTGLASLWSFQCFHISLPEPRLSFAVVVGLVLLVTTAVAAGRLGWKQQPVGILASIMLFLAAMLFAKQSAFGLFKMAMYVQPFFLGTLALAWARQRTLVRWPAVVPLLVLFWYGLQTQHSYAVQSHGHFIICELKMASEDAVFRNLAKQLRKSPAEQFIYAGDSSFTVKAASLLTGGRPMRVPVYPFFPKQCASQKNLFLPASTGDRFDNLREAVWDNILVQSFDLHDPKDPSRDNEFYQQRPLPSRSGANAAVIYPMGTLSLLNRSRFPEGQTRGLRVDPLAKVRDFLVLVDSDRGHQFYVAGGKPNVAMYQLEQDCFYPGRTMASMGKHVLFEVLNPTPRGRVMLDFTASLAANNDCRVPEAAVIGTRRLRFPVAGRGAARVISEPIAPQVIGGLNYLALDLGERTFQFKPRPSGWDRFSATLIADRRVLTSFGRNISLLSDKEFRALKPPTMLADVSKDLAHPDLEFSGIYEDSWLSEHAWFRPGLKGKADLVVEGVVPDIGNSKFQTTLTVLLDGKELARKTLGCGKFEIRLPVSTKEPRPKVELIFSHTQALPGGDGRPAAAQLLRLGFETKSTRTAKK